MYVAICIFYDKKLTPETNQPGRKMLITVQSASVLVLKTITLIVNILYHFAKCEKPS